MTLAELKRGQSARIEAVDPAEPDLVRLMVLGLVEGAEVRCVDAAIGGDPIEFSVFGSSISVRRQQAARFHVAPLDGR